MANLKKNLIYNVLLTISGYIFPLLTFPYVTRVLGAENIGIVNFAFSIVDYFVLFSTLGLTIIGLREIARSHDRKQRNNGFSQLVSIHLLLSFIALIIYLLCVLFIPSLNEYKALFWIGGSKIILNVFLVEWLYRGLQNFKYVTLRTIFTRTLYVIAIFIFVRDRSDYIIYFIITMAQVLINAGINWNYSHKFVSYSFTLQGAGKFIIPLISWGTNMILLSFYTTFNVMYLGLISGALSVGYYTTATKLYSIILSMLQAYNGVFIPYLNSLYSQGKIEEFKKTISKSFHIVSIMSIPLVVVFFVLAPEVIDVIAGKEFIPAILPFRIVLFQILIIGISQITNSQILLSLKKDKEILISTICGTATSVIILLVFVKEYAEIAAACAVTFSHLIEFLFLLYFAKKNLKFNIPVRSFLEIAMYSIPMIIVAYITKSLLSNSLLILLITGAICAIYYAFILYFVKKDEIVRKYVNTAISKFHYEQR